MRPRALGATVVLALSMLAATDTFAATGRTPGAFDVSTDGAAVYTVPIVVPPGPREVHPTLELTYNSKGGNGIMGVGWSLSGLTSIERCGRTEAQDGVAQTILMTAEDRFCLGGNRLRMVSGTTYGAAGTVYETEVTDYSKITANGGTLADGPQSFTVQGKNGWTYEYGGTDDSRVIPLLKTAVLRWKLNKVSDRSGNSYVVTYLNDPNSDTSGHAIPESISWAPTAPGGITYTYTLSFSYEMRGIPDWQNGWVAGSPVFNRQRLKDITIKSKAYGGETTVKKYSFTYQLGPVTERSRLTAITECADDAETICLPPTQLTYQAGHLGVTQGTGSTPSSGTGLTGRYDFNGDGRDDLYYEDGGTRRVALSSGNGFAPAINTGISTTAPVVVDRFSVPKRDDILVNVSGALTIYRLNSAQTAFTATAINISHPAGTIPVAADTSGDGLAELAWVGSFGRIYIRRNTTSGGGIPTFDAERTAAEIRGTTTDGGTYEGGTLYADQTPGFGLSRFDINGDGRQDLYIDVVVTYPRNGLLRSAILLSYGTWLSVPPFSTWGQKVQSTALFFNDDRCTDRLRGNVVHVSKCQNLEATTVTLPGTAWPQQLADWDGDGRTDVLIDNGGTIGVYRSNGTGFKTLLSSTLPIAAGNSFIIFDQDGDGLDDVARLNGNSLSYYTHTASGTYTVAYATNIPDMLSTIEDGYGNEIAIDYASTAMSNYQEGTPSAEPLRESSRGGLVVGRVTLDDGIGGTYTKTYTYIGARYNAVRSRQAGFQQRKEVDSRTGFIRRLTFEQLFPLIGAIAKDELLQSDGTTLISSSDFDWLPNAVSSVQYNERYFPYVSNSSHVRREVDVGGTRNGYAMTSATAAYRNLDEYGNIREVESTVTDESSGSVTNGQSWTTTTNYTYAANTTHWCLGVPEEVVVTQSSTVGETVVRTTDYDVDYAKCRITRAVVEPLNTVYEVATDISYDDDSGDPAADFGQPTKFTVTGAGMTPRVQRLTWNSTGQFPESITHEIKTPSDRAHNETTEFTYDLNLGVLETVTDPNDDTIIWDHDKFGRAIKRTAPDGTAVAWTYESCTSNCITSQHASTIAEDTLDSGGNVLRDGRIYLDTFERPLAARSRLLGTSYQWAELRYDAHGRLSSASIPCLGGSAGSCAAHWATFAYDEAGRLEAARRPHSSDDLTLKSTIYTYAGRATAATDSNGDTTTKVADANGWLRRSIDPNGYSQTFSYDAAGSLRSVVDSHSKVLFAATYEYGLHAFQRTSFDPGSVNLVDYPGMAYPYHRQTFNALGDLVAWTDPKGQSFSATYDELSRPLGRVDPDNTTRWRWGYRLDRNELGHLQEIESTLGGIYKESYEYDASGRPNRTTITVPSAGSYVYEYTYEPATGMLDRLKYPASTNACNFTVDYDYQNGILNKITDVSSASACGSTGTVLWQASAIDAFGGLTQENLGNDLIIKRAVDPVSGQLDTIKTGPSNNETLIQNLGYQFDSAGNVTLRQDNKRLLSEDFNYKTGADRLDRLEYSVIEPAGQASFENLRQTYDEPGQFGLGTIKTKTVSSGLDDVPFAQSIAWTSFNYPSEISSNGETAAFSYGPTRQRWKMTFTRGTSSETTYYIGELLERVESGGVTNFRHTIPVGSAIALVSRKSNGTNASHYVLLDHQGSVHAITSSSGTEPSTLYSSFTAYGNRRNATTWVGPPTPDERAAIDAITRQGYTYQTVLGSMGLNHMNGRVQDTLTGTFLSPDPFVTEPGYTQNFNRYSYVYNNSLTFTDPSGFSSCDSLDPVTTVSILNSPDWGVGAPSGPSLPSTPDGPAGGGLGSGGSSIWDRPTSIPTTLSGQFGPCPDETNPPYAPQYKQGVSNIGDSSVGSVSLLRTGASIAVGFLPVVGSFQSIVEVVSGKDYITGEKTSRLWAAAGIVGGLFGLKGVMKAGEKAVRHSDEIVDATKALVARTCCFVAGTLVVTKDGLRPIEEIEVGDLVLSRDEETGETAYKPVTALVRRHDRAVWELTVEVVSEGHRVTAIFETTDDHPWRTIAGQWVTTAGLSPGMEIQRADGEPARVVSVVDSARNAPTFNLEVADFKSYFVGDAGVWVHNCDVVKAVGYAQGTAETAFTAMRGGGGHAIRHLEGVFIPRTGSLASRVEAFKRLATPILEGPVHAADWRVGGTLGRAFLGVVDGKNVVVVVAKEGPYQGQVISAFIPDANQLNLMLSR